MQVSFLPQPFPTYLAEEQCDEHTSAEEHTLAYSTRASSIRQHPSSPRPADRCDEQKQKKAAQQKKVVRFKTAAQGGGTPEAPAAVDVLDMAQARANSEHNKGANSEHSKGANSEHSQSATTLAALQVLSLLALLVQKCKY